MTADDRLSLSVTHRRYVSYAHFFTTAPFGRLERYLASGGQLTPPQTNRIRRLDTPPPRR